MTHHHGSPYDRGWHDHYYRRDRSPHKWGDPCGMERIEALTDDELAEYHAGYDEAERLDERKD